MGKTSLTVRFCLGQFDDKQASTIDATCLEQVVQLPAPENRQVKLTIWDTAGQERYHALNSVYYRGAEGSALPSTCRSSHRLRHNGLRLVQQGQRVDQGATQIPAAGDAHRDRRQ